MNEFYLSIVASVVATILILLTRYVFYRLQEYFPARSIFRGIAGIETPCYVFIFRMTDESKSGRFLEPLPDYAIVTGQPEFRNRQNTPWVTSIYEAQSLAHVLNVLGRAGKTDNVEVLFFDQDFDKWDAPMFILGGGWKTFRALKTCNPIFRYDDKASRFILNPTGEEFKPVSIDHDLGILNRTVNPATGHPVWIAMGIRGAGTCAATYALARWWRELGILYGTRKFGILVGFNDKDGWQQFRIMRLHPMPRTLVKCLHPFAWHRLKRSMIQPQKQRC